MNSSDLHTRFIFEDRPIRGEVVHLNDTFEGIISQHRYPPMIRQLLGELLVISTLLTGMLKFKGRLSVQFQGQGKLKLLLAQCTHEFHLRGLAEWDEELKEDELFLALKEGIFAITMEPLKGQRYQGVVAWQGNSIAESIEGYFQNSEQLTTKIWLKVGKGGAAGLLLQIMPEEAASAYSKNRQTETLSSSEYDWEHVLHLTETVTAEELLYLDHETLLRRLYSAEDEVRVFPSVPVLFRCTCSVERSENAVYLLGRAEVDEELRDKQVLVVHCHFCNREFKFDRVDVDRIFKQKGDESSSQVH